MASSNVQMSNSSNHICCRFEVCNKPIVSSSCCLPHPLQGVTTGAEKSFGCLISVHSDAAALTSIMMYSVVRLRVGSWRPASNRKEPFTVSQPAPALVWCLVILITTPSMASSITSRAPAPTCWLGPAGSLQACPSSVWRPKTRTVEVLQFLGFEM